MARTRNIKPSFFNNDDLAELCAHTRLLFIGLWTLADKEGRLEDKPKRIKAVLFPYEEIDCHELLKKLHGKKFITRYAVNGIPYIQINNFAKHQNPHPKEQASIIPEPAEICEAVELHDEPCKEHDKKCSSFLQSFPSLSNPSSNLVDAAASRRVRATVPKPPDVSRETFEDFIRQRKTKFTATALRGIQREVAKAGIPLEEGLRIATERGWQTFKSNWNWKEENETAKPDYRKNKSERADDAAATVMAEIRGKIFSDHSNGSAELRQLSDLRERPGATEKHDEIVQ